MARRPPKPCYHRGQRRWYVTLDGRETYLHKGTRPWAKSLPKDLQPEYDRVVSEWQAGRARQVVLPTTDPSVDELWRDYLASEEVARHKKNGKPTGNLYTIRAASRVVCGLYGELPARRFGAEQMERVQARMQELGWQQRYLSQAVHRVHQAWAWAVRKGLVPASTLTELRTVTALGERDGVPQPEPVPHVPDHVIDETLPHLPAALREMVRAHRLIGCRANEICVMRAGDIERLPDPASLTGELWRYRPDPRLAPKTKPVYWIGPQAQRVLLPLLEGKAADEWVFPFRGRLGRWTTAYYRKFVARVCARHGIPPWYPLQVRHAAAEEARRTHERGLEATQARLRHRHLSTSEHYAHQLDQLGADVARRLG